MKELCKASNGWNGGIRKFRTGWKDLPGTFAKIDEVIALSAIAPKSGGIYTSHLPRRSVWDL